MLNNTILPLQLPNGCRVGKMSVHPNNWEEKEADLSIEWFIHYRFHDINFKKDHPKGYLVILKGMNSLKGRSDRRSVTKSLLDNEKLRLQKGYNPILKRVVEANELEISPYCRFSSALSKAYKLLPATKTKNEVRKALVHIQRAIERLNYGIYEIGQIKRKHVVAVLEQISRTKEQDTGKPWGPSGHNHYRSYLIMLFKQLDICEACEVDLKKVPIKKGVKKRRIMPTDQEMEIVDQALRTEFYTFWRFMHIFRRSGARMAELMQLRKENVDLSIWKFYPTVKKRDGDAEEVTKTIVPSVESLWQEVMSEAMPGDYLFARGLRPGPVAIKERQVTYRWQKHVKKKLGIAADFYSLKKKNTTEVVSRELEKIRQAQQVAADQNNHTSTAMVKKHYDDLDKERLHHQLRAI